MLLKSGARVEFSITADNKSALEEIVAEGSFDPDFAMFDSHRNYRIALNIGAAAIVKFRPGVTPTTPLFAKQLPAETVRVYPNSAAEP